MNSKTIPKLVSTNIDEYQSKAHMELAIYRIENAQKDTIEKMKNNGLLRLTVSQIWNKSSSSKLSFNWECLDAKAIVKCQEILNQKMAETERLPVILSTHRGVILFDFLLMRPKQKHPIAVQRSFRNTLNFVIADAD